MSEVRTPVTAGKLALSALLPLVAGSVSFGMFVQLMVVQPSWFMGLALLIMGGVIWHNCRLLYCQLRRSYTLSVFMDQASVGKTPSADSDEWDWDKEAAELDRLDRLAYPSRYLVPGIITHDDSQCAGEYCSVHNPSEHPLADAPLHWRADRRLMERICVHGVGHPDPDDLAYRRLSDELADGVHACDGCCREVSSDE